MYLCWAICEIKV